MNELKKNEANCRFIVIGCKSDLLDEGEPRGVPAAKVEQFAAVRPF